MSFILKRTTAALVTFIMALALITGCTSRDKGTEDPTNPPSEKPNVPPQVNAGPDQTVKEKTNIILSGAAVDVDGEITRYSWAQTGGNSAVELTGASAPAASFIAPAVQQGELLEFTLTVFDNDGGESVQSVTVTVTPENTPPTITPIADLSVEQLSSVTLSAEVEDADGEINEYKWEQQSGTPVSLLDVGEYSATFTAPALTTSETLVFIITATDNEQASAQRSVKVTVKPSSIPRVNAGANQTVIERSVVLLNGAAADSDGEITRYIWEQIAGTAVPLSEATAPATSFTAPALSVEEQLTFKLTAFDNDGNAGDGTVTITVTPQNFAPSIASVSDLTFEQLSLVTLSADIQDIDGQIIEYKWWQQSGTPVSLLDTGRYSATFTAPALTESETLVFAITAQDNEGASTQKTVKVTVTPSSLPQVNAGSDQSVKEKIQVLLSGAAVDADGEIVRYTWEQTSGSQVDIADPTVPATSFTAPVVRVEETLTFRLTAFDDDDHSGSDEVSITILPENTAPVITPMDDLSIEQLTEVTLSAAVEDLDGEIIEYKWQQQSGTTVSILDGGDYSATFTAPALRSRETLVFLISATDNENATTERTVKITVLPSSQRKVSGVAEKGPFSLGGTISFAFLQGDEQIPAKQDATVIKNNLGQYELMVPRAGFFLAEAKGQFISELTGLTVQEQISLRAFVNVLDEGDTAFNINVLTHIINQRVAFLQRVEKLEFALAESKAETELKSALSPLFGEGPEQPFSTLHIFGNADIPSNEYLLSLSTLLMEYARQNTSPIATPGKILQAALDTLEQDFAFDGLLDDSRVILAGMRSAMTTLDITQAEASLATFIENRPGVVVGSLNTFVDSDLDGVTNHQDDDDDNDNLTDDIDPLPYTPSFLVANQTIAVIEDADVEIDLTVINPNTEETIEFSVFTSPEHGTLEASPEFPTMHYTPDSDYFGTDAFTYQLKSGDVVSEIVTVTLDVQGVNDAPTISGFPQSDIEANLLYSFKPKVSDPDGDTLTFSIENLPEWATLHAETGELSGVPSNEYVGEGKLITLTVSDGTEQVSFRPFRITVEANPYTFGARMPEFTRYGDAVAFNDKIYYFGGLHALERDPNFDSVDKDGPYNNVFEYDPQADSWTVLPGAPFDATHLSAEVVGDLIYVFPELNTSTSLKSAYSFNPTTLEWIQLQDRPIYSFDFSTAAIGDTIYFFGGFAEADPSTPTNIFGDANFRFSFHDETRSLNHIYIFNTATGVWSQATDMPEYSTRACAESVEDKIYVLGGLRALERSNSSESSESDKVWVYEPELNEWRESTIHPTRYFYDMSCAEYDGNIFYYSSSYNTRPTEVFYFDTISESWFQGRERPSVEIGSDDNSNAYDVASVSYNNKIYILGGFDYYQPPLVFDSTIIYDPQVDIDYPPE